MKKLLLILICGIILVGCSNENENNLINYKEAKEMMINDGAILIDVRTAEEYQKNHIEGATLLSLDTITKDQVATITTNKEDIIIVYCQSGKRSSQAKEQLKELGYKKVYDLGAMSNWEE